MKVFISNICATVVLITKSESARTIVLLPVECPKNLSCMFRWVRFSAFVKTAGLLITLISFGMYLVQFTPVRLSTQSFIDAG
ncbi:MAG: hypothetical protein EBY21_15835 [Alphaproteobacteria bacterium]|nr:hypothetical protein [Alphaproteobacteria bacterium]